MYLLLRKDVEPIEQSLVKTNSNDRQDLVEVVTNAAKTNQHEINHAELTFLIEFRKIYQALNKKIKPLYEQRKELTSLVIAEIDKAFDVIVPEESDSYVDNLGNKWLTEKLLARGETDVVATALEELTTVIEEEKTRKKLLRKLSKEVVIETVEPVEEDLSTSTSEISE